MKKKIALILCLLLQVLVFGTLLLKIITFQPEVYEISYQDFVRTTIPDDQEGWYIDSSFPCLESGLFVHTEKMSMKPGVYRITAKYNSTSASSYSTVKATTNAFYGLFVDRVPLNEILGEVSYCAYLFDDSEDFSVEFYYGGSGELIAKDVKIESTRKLLTIQMSVFLFFACLLDFCLWAVKKSGSVKEFLSRKRMMFFLILGTVFVSIPTYIGAIRYGVDIGFHLIRIEGLKQELLSGNIPVKMQSIWQYGYGYPVSLFYGDLFLLIPVSLRILGFSVQFSYNCFLFVINFATIAIAYWSVKKISHDSPISYLCAMLYAMMPYRISDMYEGSTIGEVLAITFLPLLFYGFWVVFTTDEADKNLRKQWIPLVLGFSGIIQSHVLTCVLTAYLVILVCLLNIKKVFQKNRFLVLAKTVIYTSVLNAWFLFPCMGSMDHLDIRQPYRNAIRIQENGADVLQLFTFWGKGNICVKGIGFGLGIGLILFLYLLTQQKKEASKNTKFIGLLTCITLLLSTTYFPWNWISEKLGDHAMMINNIQFPSRFLSLAGMLAMFLLCFGLMDLDVKLELKKLMIYGVLLLSVISCEYTMTTGNETDDVRSVYDIAKLGRTDYCIAEYVYFEETNYTMQEFVESKVNLNELYPNRVVTSEGVEFAEFQRDGTNIGVRVNNLLEQDGYIELPLLFYIQYSAIDSDGNRLQTKYGDNHVLRVVIPAYFEGNISVSYQQPFWWYICYIVSLAGWIAFVIVMMRLKKKDDDSESEYYF